MTEPSPQSPVRSYAFMRIAWIGSVLGRIEVSPDVLELRASILGRYRFAPEDVIAFDTSLPIRRIRIDHIRGDIPTSVVLIPMGSRAGLLERISAAGFVPRAKPSDRVQLPPALHQRFVTLVVLAQLAFGVAAAVLPHPPSLDPLGIGFVVLWFTVSVLLRVEGPFRRFAVDSPISFGRLRPFLNFSTLILGAMLVAIVAELLERGGT